MNRGASDVKVGWAGHLERAYKEPGRVALLDGMRRQTPTSCAKETGAPLQLGEL